jgi:hypothetical protein
VEQEKSLVLVLEAAYQFHLDKLREPESRSVVEWALEQVLNQPIHVKLTLRRDDGGGIGGSSGSGSTGRDPTGSGQRPAPPPAAGGGAGLSSPKDDSRHNRREGSTGDQHGAARLHDASTAPKSNITPIRPDIQPVPWAPESPFAGPLSPEAIPQPNSAEIDAGQIQQLEAEVRADPVIQSLLRVQGMELVDVHVLRRD